MSAAVAGGTRAAPALPTVPAVDTRRLLWGLLRYRGWVFWFTVATYVVLYCLAIVGALVIRQLFDTLSGQAPAALSWWSLLALWVAAEAGRTASYYALIWGETTYQITLFTLIRGNLFRRILELPGARALPFSPGESISRVHGDAEAVQGFMSAAYNLAALTTFAAIALVIMARVNLPITVCVFLPCVAVAVVANQASKRVTRYRAASREAAGRVSGALGEMFGGVQAIKVADAEVRVVDHFRQLSDSRRGAAIKDRMFEEVLSSIYGNLRDLGTGVILLLVGQSMRAGTFTVGDFALFVYFLDWTSSFSSFIGIFWARYKQLGVSFARLAELLRGAPPETIAVHRPVHLHGALPEVSYETRRDEHRLEVLEARGLGYRHPDTGRGIEGVDLRLARGTFTVVTGRIGSGKTTLLRVLLGLLPRDAGEIRWNGALVDDPASILVPPRCAYTPQVPRLFSDTLQNNILLGLPDDPAALDAAIRLAVLEQDLGALERGLETVVGPRGVRLSGGQVQRAAAARMLVRGGELLVFDDLSSALDVETERQLWERIGAWPDATVLAVSHRRAALRRAGQIVVLAGGRVAAVGRLEELLASSEDMRRLWDGVAEEAVAAA